MVVACGLFPPSVPTMHTARGPVLFWKAPSFPRGLRFILCIYCWVSSELWPQSEQIGMGVEGLWKQSHWPLIHKKHVGGKAGSLCRMPGSSGKSPGWEPRETWVRIRTSVLSLAPRVCACSLTDHKMTSCHTVSLAKFSKIMCLKWRPKHLKDVPQILGSLCSTPRYKQARL